MLLVEEREENGWIRSTFNLTYRVTWNQLLHDWPRLCCSRRTESGLPRGLVSHRRGQYQGLELGPARATRLLGKMG